MRQQENMIREADLLIRMAIGSKEYIKKTARFLSNQLDILIESRPQQR
jgi:hypothetical protein